MEQSISHAETRRQAVVDHERRRRGITFTATGDLDEEAEDRLKQLYLVRRMYADMLARRLAEDQRRCDKLVAAFQRIRSATGTHVMVRWGAED